MKRSGLSPSPGEPHERKKAIHRLLTSVLSAVAFVVPAHHRHHHYHAHNPGCRTPSCDVRVWKAEGYKKALRKAAELATGWAPAGSVLEACIIRKESGGDPQAVSGIYMGIGQWEQSRWESDGGLRYAPTPLKASYAQQEAVLRSEGEAGMIQQQGQYDGCA